MLTLVESNRFRKELQQVYKQGKDLRLLRTILDDLQHKTALAAKCRDHKLIGNYASCRECHIQPDWLLIYRIDGKNLVLERTGYHAELFS